MRIGALFAASILFASSAAWAAAATAPADRVDQWQALKRRADWVGIERDARAALADLAAHGGKPEDVATATLWLGDGVAGQDRWAEAEKLYRTALDLRRKALGARDPDTAVCMEDIALALMGQGRYREAEPLVRRAVAIDERALGAKHPRVARSENILARLLRDEGRYPEAEPHFRRALAIRESALGANDPETATSLNNLGLVLWSEGRFPEAESLMRRSLAIREAALGPDAPDTALSLQGLALVIKDQGRFSEAEPLYRRALAVTEAAQGEDRPATALVLSNLGSLLWDDGRHGEVAPLLRRALAIREKTLGPDHPDTAMSLNNLAFVLEDQGQHAEAESLYRRALAIDERVLGPRHAETAIILRSLGELLQDQDRFADSEPLFRRAVSIDDSVLGAGHPDTADASQSLAYTEERLSQFRAAAGAYRSACAVRSTLADAREQIGEAAATAKFKASRCSMRLALTLRMWSEHGGGGGERPDALRREAFLAAQRAALSAAGEAMARSAALAAARSAGVGEQATDYEAALTERDRLDQDFAKAASEAGDAGVARRDMLDRARADALRRIDALAATLQTAAPRYWDLRSPDPIDIAALQATTGADAALLGPDEALLTFLVPPGQDQGVVFAVTKTRTAWGRIPLTGDQLEQRVRELRTPLERNYRAFDRRAAFDLYTALLGDGAIQDVIRDKPVLLFVPAGPLTSVPPGLLVTAPPQGGAAGDSDQSALRSTPWLLRGKAVAMLPAVSSLRTLRELGTVDHGAASDPLLAFADPDFGGAAPPPSDADAEGGAGLTVAARSYSTYFNHGRLMAEALRALPQLPGTLVEGEALMTALDGRPGSLLTGRDASKAELMARNADGRLAKVRVLEFATHGLVAGAATWLAEPALALAAGAKPEDELLLASEASTLKLNADWVLLSACNTASPDAPEAEGLSGLSRAFFFAGAHSLLVSHWRVRDDVAARLIPAILLAERDKPGLSHAMALRQASLAILDDPDLHAANPSAWAPFTLVGEPER